MPQAWKQRRCGGQRNRTHGTKERKREDEERKKGRCRKNVKGQGGAGVPKWEDARSGPKEQTKKQGQRDERETKGEETTT